MTSANELPEEPGTEETTPAKNKSKGKSKSPGFIEPTSFKPSWLETGPLSPEMLPPEREAQVPVEIPEDPELSDDLVAQLAELERLYSESGEPLPAPIDSMETIVVTADPDETSATAQTAEEVEATAEGRAAALVSETADIVTAASEAVDDDIQVSDEILSDASEGLGAAATLEQADPLAETEVITAVADDLEFEGVEAAAADTVVEVSPVAAVATPKPAARAETKPKRKHPLFDGLARTLLIIGLILIGLAAIAYFVNPFARLALSTAELARPAASLVVTSPAGADSDWCVTGSFLNSGQSPIPMQDSGRTGDIVEGDQVFALQMDTLAPGNYQWQVVGCDSGDLAYPANGAWIQVTANEQPVTFLFDSEERDDPLFFPIPFTVSALDGANNFQVVGSFQDWNPDDTSAKLQHLGGGVYQQVRRIARPGTYEAYVISGNLDQAIDAYGRTNEPIPFSFETSRRSETVVFLLDTNRGRASVLYGMPWVATQLAYGPGFRALSLLLGLGGLLLLAWMLLRMIMMGNDANWLEAGCPQCGRHELMRISRRPTDRMLNALGIPAYRYQCRDCTWTGTRLSEDGASVSPGATTIMADIGR